MNQAEFRRRYAESLATFLERSDEESLQRGYELGRDAMEHGLGLLDVALVHTATLESALDARLSHADRLPRRTWEFLAETLAPFEMALRGFREANAALRDSAATLERRVAERTSEIADKERALREQASLLSSIVESISDGITVADETGKLILTNAASRRLGTPDVPPEEWPRAFGVFQSDGRTPFPWEEAPLLRAIQGERTKPVEMLVRNDHVPTGVHLSVIGSPVLDDDGTVRGGVVVFRDVTETRRAQEVVRASEERYRAMFDNNPLPVFTVEKGSLTFVSVNQAALVHYGYALHEFQSMTFPELFAPDDRDALVAHGDAPLEGRIWRHRQKDGGIIQVEIKDHDFELNGGEKRLVLVRDVTAREHAAELLHKTEEQLRQSQKMDAVGRLAGGIAHDFNNLLSVILSYSETLLADLRSGEPMRQDIDEIRKAGMRAAALTRQLLLFSRRQVLQPRVLDLNESVSDLEKMLRRILGADIELVSVLVVPHGRIRADAGSIEQLVMNLVVNARDAMPTGGKLTVETANVVLDESYVEMHLGSRVGPHVMLAVTDTGVGMNAETRTRIFEPFFTTKPQGKGTGLGLSTVFGIVQQAGGSIWVYSEPGHGTTFKIYFPSVDAPLEESCAPQAVPVTLRGTETILLVDDDDQVRSAAAAILRKNRYRVIEARNAGEALLHAENEPGTIDLLLSDVVMPQMSGPELARRLGAIRSNLKVLCMSGYTDESIVRHGLIHSHVAYLQKPITPQTLLAKVREVLDVAPS